MRNTRSRQNTQYENNMQTLYRIIIQYTYRNAEYALSLLQVNWADGWNTRSPFSKLTKLSQTPATAPILHPATPQLSSTSFWGKI